MSCAVFSTFQHLESQVREKVPQCSMRGMCVRVRACVRVCVCVCLSVCCIYVHVVRHACSMRGM